MKKYSPDFWHECFIYFNGLLIWRIRPDYHFDTTTGAAVFNGRFPGRPACNIHTAKRSRTAYLQTSFSGGGHFKAHRIVWEMHNGAIPDGYEIDHIDGNGLNNCIENLRVVNQLESMHNMPKQKSNTSGVVGVCWHKSANKWQARISFDGERFDLGRYDSFLDAVSVRKSAERRFGYHENHGMR